MGSCVKKNNLNRYLQKLKNIAKIDYAETVASIIADKGVEIAKAEYAVTSKHTKVTSEKKGSKATVVASRKGLTFIEYGTGLVGQGTYDGKLPTSGVPITGNWEYYYDSPHKKNGGWYFGNTFTEGRVAGMQMYRTAKSLGEYVKKGELVEDLKKELRK